ncbi:acyl-CoA dehydrogenase family protein, partial [bacterium]|nr:acyl-CoA dehydrogenase family protein [bacterium]
MDFSFNREQLEIQKAVRGFCKGEFSKELAYELDDKHEFPTEVFKKAANLGFIGIGFPEKYSGQGMGVIENTIVVEEFCRADSTIGSALALSYFASECVLNFASDDLKERFLPLVAEGKTLSAGAFTEPDHGSDISRMDTTAVRDGDEWVINGTKVFITNAALAGFFSVLVQTDPDASPSRKGISMILVEADRKGLSTTDVGKKMGIRSTATGEVVFKDVRVPLTNLIGEEGRGFYQVLHFFDESRIMVAAQALGIAECAFDRALAYIKEREQFGKKLSMFQVTQHKIADMHTKIEL